MNNILNNADIMRMKSIIIEAGNIGQGIQKENFTSERKNDKSIVTKADIIIQDYLINKLKENYSYFNIIHEENFDRSVNNFDEKKISVIIDPIDGTAMFSMHLPIWCVSVGIFIGYTPVYGFIYSPGSSMFFYNDNSHSYLNDRIVKVDKELIIDNETNIFYSTEIFNKVNINFSGKVRNLGSTALHAALISDNRRNRVLAFIGKSYLWDWAGAIPIIMKAGGYLRYLNGMAVNFQDIINNKYELLDYLIAYTIDDFDLIKQIFSMSVKNE